MIPFDSILGQVRRRLREASAEDIQLLLLELAEAQVLSQDYCRSLAQERDGEDVARQISLAMWQNWELCCGPIQAALDRVQEGGTVPRSPTVTTGPGMQEMPLDLLDLLDFPNEELEYLDSGSIFSPNPYEFPEDGSLNESIDNLIRYLTEQDPDEVIGEPSLPEPASSVPADTRVELDAPRPAKRDHGAAAPSYGCRTNKRRKRGPRVSGKPKKGKTTKSQHRFPKKDSGKATSSPEPTSQGLVMPQASQGVFQLSQNTLSQLLPLSISTFSSAAFLNPCAGTQTIQLIPAVTYPQQVINISVPNALSPGTPTYILGVGAVVPSEHVVSTPVSSCSDSAFQACSPESASTPSPTADIPPCKGLSYPTHEPEPSKKPKCVDDYIHLAKAQMAEDFQVMDVENATPMELLYIDVPLVQRRIQVKSRKNANKCLEKEFVVLSDADRKEASLLKSQLFEDTGQKENRLIALLGQAGVGKTTFVRRLCLDWSHGDLSGFEFVFLLDCRALNVPDANYGLKNLLLDLSSSPPCKNSSTVFKHILCIPKSVLIIFDGFDDFKDYEGLLHSPATCDTKNSFSIKQLISGLIQKKLLCGCTLLVTARPKEIFNQFLGKVDRIVELCGFSPEDVSLYLSKYFKDSSSSERAVNKLKSQQYIFSLCSNPLICRYVCFLLQHSDCNKQLPLTLAGLFQRVFDQKIHVNQGEGPLKPQQKLHVAKLCRLAWAGVKTHNSILSQSDQEDVKEFGLSSGILSSYVARDKSGTKESGCAFAHPAVQSFLGALHLVQSRDVGNKTLLVQAMAPPKRRRPQAEWLDATRRFALGLLFQKEPPGTKAGSKAAAEKRGLAAAHLRSLKPTDLGVARLLELCHCVYESCDAPLARHLVKSLPADLCFSGVHLAPPDVFILQHLLQRAKDVRKAFSINLQDTGINLQGLKDLLELKCVLSFRASLMDTINLWEDLQRSNERQLLKSTIAKFTFNPFKATQLSHIEHLAIIVEIYRERKLPHSEPSCTEPILDSDTFDIPAVRNLQKLELSLGPSTGSTGFSKLVAVLPTLCWLRHLDLEDNKIGDTGAEKLAEVLPDLTSLEMLNLSQNCIGDKGLEKLAPALPSLTSLHSLSLYSNFICDSGAESLAKVLPEISTLTDLDVKDNRFTGIGAQMLSDGLKNAPRMKTVRMWNYYIPHGVLEHLKQQDSRIRPL